MSVSANKRNYNFRTSLKVCTCVLCVLFSGLFESNRKQAVFGRSHTPTHCNSLQLQNIRYAVHAFSMLLSECTNIPCAHRVAYPTPKLPTVACLPAVREKLSARLPHKCASVGVCVCVCACKFDASKLSRTLYTSQFAADSPDGV